MPRLTAVRILLDLVQNHRSLTQLRPKFEQVDPRDRALVQEICFGVARWYFRLEYLAKRLLNKPLRNKDFDIQMTILVGLYQLFFMRIPAYAAISATVEVARAIKKDWATKLINGLLRTALKDQDALIESLAHDEMALYSHPQWLLEKIKGQWQNWQAILEANNAHPALCLRVNQLQIGVDDYLALLQTKNIGAQRIAFTQNGLVLDKPVDVTLLPGFEAGMVSVQDGAAQLAAPLLDPKPHDNILDACAAPGGKTGHLLEYQPRLAKVVALDNDERRLAQVHQNLARLKLSAEIINQSVTELSAWQPDQFNAILLDAPCSATGVINRHPDIKLLRNAKDLTLLTQIQRAALQNVWPTLKSKGRLLYVTCSILAEENEQIITEFLASHHDARESVIESPWGIALPRGRQILPGMHLGMDGFYFALLEKH